MTFAMIMAMLGISSCSKTDLYDEGKIAEREAAEAAAKQAKLIEDYKANFVKTYGEINPNQSWDFSTNDMSIRFHPVSSQVRTRGNSTPAVVTKHTDYVPVLESTLEIMNTNFEEGINHEDKGTYFGMNAPKNDFYIQPIFMGQSGGNFELHLKIVDTNQDILVWSKWDGIQYKKGNNTNWQTLSSSHNESGNNLVGVNAIQTKPIKISGVPENAEMYFYLLITSAASGYNHKYDKLGSVEGYIREYSFTADEALLSNLWGVDATSSDPIQCKLIGCEDANIEGKTDKDYNDVVFLLYGQPTVPQSFKVKYFYKDVKKRFMIEDLGSADDSDFNDIVVDVIESYKAEVWYDENENPLSGYDPENPSYTLESTKAEIRALGGTLDFDLNIGDKTTWNKKAHCGEEYTEMKNTTDPDYEKVLYTFDVVNVKTDPSGYDPEKNNISLIVYQEDGITPAAKIGFPSTGSIPMIIATDTDVNWSKERKPFGFSKYLNAATE